MIAAFLRKTCASLLVASSLLMAACTTAPGTGRTIFTGGLSEEGEVALGLQEHPKVIAQFGGVYDDPALTGYISSLGELLVSTSELPDLDFTFTVLDTPIVNAFALPGGYVYITRGLLALAQDEAEVAGVLAHEIGHVTARHGAERHGQNLAAGIATMGLGLLGGQAAASAGGGIGAVVLKSYSRDQEFEADMLGVRYLARAGYDTRGMAEFLQQLQSHARLEAEIAGQPGRADEFDIMQTHPRTTDRIEKAIAEAQVVKSGDPMTARRPYLKKIDNMLYGDDPKQGITVKRRFSHPDLRFTFEVPEGFRIINTPQQVVARNGSGAVILFDQAKRANNQSMSAYLQKVWGKNTTLSNRESIDVNGLKGATATARVDTRNGPRDFRLVAIAFDNKTIYRFLFITPPDQTKDLGPALRETTHSFRKLSKKEAAAIKPLRLRLYKVQEGDTASEIAARFPFEDFKLERLAVINGLGENPEIKVGQTIKIITQE
ncbi:MAG: M48 family metalloprotease [Pseudomonadota bacterium]